MTKKDWQHDDPHGEKFREIDLPKGQEMCSVCNYIRSYEGPCKCGKLKATPNESAREYYIQFNREGNIIGATGVSAWCPNVNPVIDKELKVVPSEQLTEAQELCRELVKETTLAIKKYEDAPENHPEDNHINAINCLDEIEALLAKARETMKGWGKA